MTRIADAFVWPFRAGWTTWLLGAVAVLLLPVAFIPLLGYAVAAVRAGESPPRWTFSQRLLTDGFWTALAVALTMLPFAAAFVALSRLLGGVALVIAFFALALPWGLIALLLLPHGTAEFARSGNPRALFDAGASLRGVRRDFASWNVVAAAVVTAWAVGLACVGLLCVGIVPGIFYAILVSAHATAALTRQDSNRPAR